MWGRYSAWHWGQNMNGSDSTIPPDKRYRNVARGAFGRKSHLYRAIFFASALNFAQRFFVAFPIFALAAAESTRLVLFVTFLSADRPIASAAALMPLSLC